MNFCGIDGTITKDIEIGTTVNGKTFAKFCIAHNYYFGEEKKVDFYNVTAWEKVAEKMRKFGKKGMRVCICGKMKNTAYEAKDGTKKQYFQIEATEVELIFSNNQKDQAESKPIKQPKQIPLLEEISCDDGDLPF